MLKIRRIEVEGFGPFADRQVVELPDAPGVTVVYGENMRGKTSMLNAIRYAFFGTVVGRGSRERLAHTVTNRERASVGRFGFSVALTFEHDESTYELVRECCPRVVVPTGDDDYIHEVLLRKGSEVLGPNERARTLTHAFPKDISRFFLFDGELLQEYEELLHNDKEDGRKISESIERILGVPILKRGKVHLSALLAQADTEAGQAASRHKETQAVGAALELTTKQKQAHIEEHLRLSTILQKLTEEKADIERRLQGMQKYASILEDRDRAAHRRQEAEAKEKIARAELQPLMDEAWRTLLAPRIQYARLVAQQQAQAQVGALSAALRRKAAEKGTCEVCLQPVADEVGIRLRASLYNTDETQVSLSGAMARLADLTRFKDRDVAGEVNRLARTIQALELEQVSLANDIKDF